MALISTEIHNSAFSNMKFLADLDKNCAGKQKLYDENVKMRGQELAALADTIKILNDYDALELFKKTHADPRGPVQLH